MNEMLSRIFQKATFEKCSTKIGVLQKFECLPLFKKMRSFTDFSSFSSSFNLAKAANKSVM